MYCLYCMSIHFVLPALQEYTSILGELESEELEGADLEDAAALMQGLVAKLADHVPKKLLEQVREGEQGC